MELRQLEYFIAVAEEANFTRAAARVHISQSGISAQIRELERDLGATLLDRSRRAATLTAAGEAALEHARSVVASVDAVRLAVDEVNGLIRGRLVVGMVAGCTVTPLFDGLSAFHVAHPGVDITLVEDTSDRLIERVRAASAGMALVGVAGAPPEDLEALSIVSERLVAVVPTGHPLAERSQVRLAGLSGYPMVCMPDGTGVRTVFDQACASKGIQPDIALEASAPSAVADLALRGLGVAILSESMIAHDGAGLKGLVISDIKTPAVLALVWATTMSPALRELVPHVRRAFTTQTPGGVRPAARRGGDG